MDSHESNWKNADHAKFNLERSKRELQLVCPSCKWENRPGNRLIELDERGTAVCGTCGHVWAPEFNSA